MVKKFLKRFYLARLLKNLLLKSAGVLTSPLPIRFQLFQSFLKYAPFVKHSTKLSYDAVERPGYSYGIMNAVIQAKSLGYSSMSILEFGVASGQGIKVMQKIQREVLKELNFEILIYGFDSSIGLPKSTNIKDQIYFWEESMFTNHNRDYSEIQNNKTQIIIGNVEETASTFIDKFKPPVIGFIAFDLDFYTSTIGAFSLLEKINIDNFLPRVESFMDDTASYNYLSANSHTGVLSAIIEFNKRDAEVQILQKVGIGRSRKVINGWFDACFVIHFFSNERYNEFINS